MSNKMIVYLALFLIGLFIVFYLIGAIIGGLIKYLVIFGLIGGGLYFFWNKFFQKKETS